MHLALVGVGLFLCTVGRGWAQERILPDTTLTPGMVRLDVTQENLAQTICNPHWHTAAIRPSTAYTAPLKRRLMAAYGYADQDQRRFELDHLVPLELGGHPTDPQNLWPQAWDGPQGARAKDRLENILHRAVCAGTLPLAPAQHCMAQDWTTCLMLDRRGTH